MGGIITFDEAYYKDLWKDIHRHDYCENLANQLIQQYGKVSMLDIGTGCGYLVKLLREKGVDAWGLEVSEYAINNSCSENIRLGDVRNIPFAANIFNVVHSQGLWEYVSNKDIQKAWNECKRVGNIQKHTIDYKGSIIGEEDFLTSESEEWWKNQFYPRVLVGCPIHESKEYSLQRWIDNIKKFSYPNYDILMVDNSLSEDFMNRWKNQIPIIHIETNPEWIATTRINQSMEILRREFLKGDYERFFCIESDIIPQSDIIERLLEWGKDTDWISHAYPDRLDQNTYIQGIGCSIFTRRLLKKYGFADIDDGYYSDAGLWEKIKKSDLKTMELWKYLNIKHLKE